MSDVSDQRRYYERMIDEIAVEHRQQIDQLEAENAKLRELMGDLYGEYRYLRIRHHRVYLQHEERMRAIESRMRDLGVEAE